MDDAAVKNRKASRAEGKKPFPRLRRKTPAPRCRSEKGLSPWRSDGKPPPWIVRGKDKGRRPARHENHAPVQAALFSLTVGQSGARSDGGRSGFRENPRHRTRGGPHEELARPAFSATVTLPLRLPGKTARSARHPRPTRPRPAGAEWSLSRPRKQLSGSPTAPRQRQTPAPPGFAGSAVRADGPGLVPSRGGARKWALPFLFCFRFLADSGRRVERGGRVGRFVNSPWTACVAMSSGRQDGPSSKGGLGPTSRRSSPPFFPACVSKRAPGGHSDHPTILTRSPSTHALPFPAVGSIR